VTAGAAGAGSLRSSDRAPVTLCVEDRQGPRGMFTAAVPTGDRRVGLGHRAQGVETIPAVQAYVLVDRHWCDRGEFYRLASPQSTEHEATEVA